MENENDALNEHEPESSMTLDPPVDESARVEVFQQQRDLAIEQAYLRWRRKFASGETQPVFQSAAFHAGVEAAASLPRVHRIGVFDYDSLVECLRTNFSLCFPGTDMRDPQNGIQLLAAFLMEARKVPPTDVLLEAYAKALRQTAPQINASWLDENGLISSAVEVLRKVLQRQNQIPRESGTESSTTTTRACSEKEL